MVEKRDVLVIGGGVIGVCIAYYLVQKGREVTILEQGEIGSGSSFGNTGLIVPGHSIPLAHPGALGQGLKWLLRSDSPFYVKPRFDWELINWLWKFVKASNVVSMREGIRILSELGYASLELLESLVADEGLDCDYHQKGWLMAYRTAKGMEAAIEETQLLGEFGVESAVLSRDEMTTMEPALRPDLAGGVYLPNEAHLNPARFVEALAVMAAEKGVKSILAAQVQGLESGNGKVRRVWTTKDEFEPQQVVVAAGAWSPELVKELGIKLPVQAAKGYSVTLPNGVNNPKIALYFGEAMVAATPLDEGLRLAGTLEMTGMDFEINRRRVTGILRSAGEYIELPKDAEQVEPWRGLRPCTPDGLPIMSRAPKHKNLYLATGHCMLGMTLGPITGKLMAQLMCGQQPEIGLEPFNMARF